MGLDKEARVVIALPDKRLQQTAIAIDRARLVVRRSLHERSHVRVTRARERDESGSDGAGVDPRDGVVHAFRCHRLVEVEVPGKHVIRRDRLRLDKVFLQFDDGDCGVDGESGSS